MSVPGHMFVLFFLSLLLAYVFPEVVMLTTSGLLATFELLIWRGFFFPYKWLFPLLKKVESGFSFLFSHELACCQYRN